ncbi:MAG: hypothetical protein ACLGHT_00775 [Acidimicrobiia bacterium]
MPNNRQLAFIFWAVVALVWVLSRRDMRSSVRNVLRTAASPKLLAPLLVLAAWVGGLVYIGSRLRLWDGDRATDTVFWFVTAGLVLFGNFAKVSSERHFLRRTTLATLEIASLIAVLSEVFVLNLVAELLLLPVLVALGGMSAVSAARPEHRQVKKMVDGIIAVGSIAMLLYVVFSLVNNWGSLDKGDLLQQFALPVWLTAGVVPYIYMVGLLSSYELAFVRIDFKSERTWWARTRAKLVLLMSFHVRAREVGAFSGPWQFKLASARSFGEGRRVIAEFRQAQLDAAREAEEKQARLVQYADVDGVDEDGRRLDQREFEETTEALRWLGTCQMGWYRNRDAGRYREDLLDFVLDSYATRGLPHPPEIQMRVSADGQKWFAWRRTASGWVFAIGAAGPPPDQWEYDGPEPPVDFPGDDPAWGARAVDQTPNVNW